MLVVCIRVYLYVTRKTILLEPVCIRMYPCDSGMLLVCTRMYRMLLICYPYVTRSTRVFF